MLRYFSRMPAKSHQLLRERNHFLLNDVTYSIVLCGTQVQTNDVLLVATKCSHWNRQCYKIIFQRWSKTLQTHTIKVHTKHIIYEMYFMSLYTKCMWELKRELGIGSTCSLIIWCGKESFSSKMWTVSS